MTGSTGCSCSGRAGRCTRSGCGSRSTSRSATRAGVVLRTCDAAPGPGVAPGVAGPRSCIEAEAGAFDPLAARGAATASSVREHAAREPEGALVLVGTPIGNLGDLSPRAVEALRDADVIAAEDTRRTRALLTHAGVPGGARLRRGARAQRAAQAPSWSSTRSATATASRTSPTPGCPASPIPASASCACASTPASRSRWCPGRARCSRRSCSRGFPPTASCSRASCRGAGARARERLAALAAEEPAPSCCSRRRTGCAATLARPARRVRRRCARSPSPASSRSCTRRCGAATLAERGRPRRSRRAARRARARARPGAAAARRPSDDEIDAARAPRRSARASRRRDAAARVAARPRRPRAPRLRRRHRRPPPPLSTGSRAETEAVGSVAPMAEPVLRHDADLLRRTTRRTSGTPTRRSRPTCSPGGAGSGATTSSSSPAPTSTA